MLRAIDIVPAERKWMHAALTLTHPPMCVLTMDGALLFGVFNYYIANLYLM